MYKVYRFVKKKHYLILTSCSIPRIERSKEYIVNLNYVAFISRDRLELFARKNPYQ